MAVVMPGLERRLKAELTGEVRFDRFTRGRYATDASHYQIMPVGVVAPRTIEEAERAIGIARAEGVTVLARGGGTSQAGQTVGQSLVVDCSKYLTRILDLDVKRARCTVEPGIVLDDLNRAAQAARPVVSGRYLDRRRAPPSAAWPATTPAAAARCATAPCATTSSSIEALLADGTLAHFGRIGGNLDDVPAPLRPLAKDLLAIGAREADEIAARFPEGAAPRRRLQSRCAGARQERHQSRARAGRLRRHARLFHAHRIEAFAAARPPRRRRLPFRQLLRGDERGAAHRAAEADRGRADRPHHDRAGARDPDVPADAGQIRARRRRRQSCWSSSARTTTRKICAACSSSRT